MIERLRRVGAMLVFVALMGCDAPEPTDTIAVEAGWFRPPLVAGRPAAGYFELINRSNATLNVTDVVITAPPGARVEMHETISRGDRLSMRRIESLEVRAGERIAFEPGGRHLMVFGIGEETTYIDFELKTRERHTVRGRLPARRDLP